MPAPDIRIDALLRDPLSYVRSAARPVGYVGFDQAADVLATPSISAVHLPWDHRQETTAADRWLEDSFPGWARSIFEDWLAGRFDFMECVVFTRGDDTSQRLYYYVCELQRRGIVAGPKPLIFDIAKIPRPSSRAWTVAAVRQLAEDLDADDDALEEGIRIANRRRRLLRGFDVERGLPAPYYERLARASLFAPIERLVLDAEPEAPAVRRRVLLAGSSPPDDTLHVAADAAGWTVAGELFDRNFFLLGAAVDAHGGAPAERIGKAAHRNRCGPRRFANSPDQVLAAASERGADAVAFWLHEEDEALAWDVIRDVRVLQDNGIPTLVMSRRHWSLSDRPDTALQSFLAEHSP